MFFCPVCQKSVEVSSRLDVGKHLRGHINSLDYPVAFPLKCLQNECCASSFESLDGYVKHFHNRHTALYDNRDIRHPPNLPQPEVNIPNDIDGQEHGGNLQIGFDPEHDAFTSVYTDEAMKLILSLVGKSSITFNCVYEVLHFFDSYMEKTIANVKTRLEAVLASVENVEQNNAFVTDVLMEELEKSRQALCELNTEYKIHKRITDHPLYLGPVEIVLGQREETHRGQGGKNLNVTVKDRAYYIPIIGIIRNLFLDEAFASLLVKNQNCHVSADGVYSSFCDSNRFKKHPLFSDLSKLSLRIQLFYDGMGTTNPLRGHSTVHNIGVFYFTIQNLDEKYSANFQKVHLLAMLNTLDVKIYGFDTILRRIMKDIKVLETTGITVQFGGENIQVYGALSQFCGDSLATNEIFGMVQNFSTCDYCCAICYGTKLERSLHFHESSFQLRTRESHAQDLETLNQNPNLLHVRGVKNDSHLNNSNYHHVFENRSLDLMHAMPEGNLPNVTGCVLYELITVQKFMSFEELNRRIRWLFQGLNVDKGNTPAELNQINLPGEGLSPKLTANEMLSFFRYLPLILGPVIPEGNIHWALFLQLQTITDIAYAPVLTDEMLDYFEEIYEDHMLLFKELYPELTIKPKQHFLVHFKTVVKENGPLRHLSCMKYELRNGFFKRLSHVVCNFKNISKTLTMRNQYTSLAHAVNNKNIRDEFDCSFKVKKTVLQSLDFSDLVSRAMEIPLHTIVDISDQIYRFGQRYSVGNIVIISKESFEYQFGIISLIVCNEEKCFVVLDKLSTVGFNSHLHAYNVSKMAVSDFICVELSKILDYHPLDLYHNVRDAKLYVRLKYQVFSKSN